MDADEIFSKQLHQMEKEKKERDSKLKAQEKKVCVCVCVCVLSENHPYMSSCTLPIFTYAH